MTTEEMNQKEEELESAKETLKEMIAEQEKRKAEHEKCKAEHERSTAQYEKNKVALLTEQINEAGAHIKKHLDEITWNLEMIELSRSIIKERQTELAEFLETCK